MLAIVVTHPRRNVCGEITHWERTVVHRFRDQEDFRTLLDLDHETACSVWDAVHRLGSYHRAFGRPFWPHWLGRFAEWNPSPEKSVTADLALA